MPIVDEVDTLLAHIREQAPIIHHNGNLLAILEGDLMRFITEHLVRELKEASLKDALPRIAPINFYKRIISKLAKIYQQSVQRRIIDGNDRDQELLQMYEHSMRMDCVMNVGNEFYNAFKTNLNQIYLGGDANNGMGRPSFRPIPNNKFYVYSNDEVDPTNPTHIILPMGREKKQVRGFNGQYEDSFVDIWKVYTADEIYIIDGDGDTRADPMSEGTNPFGLDMFMYVNSSKNFLNPPPDSDSFQMSVLLPVLISDLNYAVKYMSFSLVYGVDVDSENLTRSPNAFWALKSDPTSDRTPQVGQIKPQVDIADVMQLIIAELSMWLNSRNIRPGSVSDMTADNVASGISKLVDEADTTDERKKQVESYTTSEEHFWNGSSGNAGVLHRIHPMWVAQNRIDPKFRTLFSPNARVEISFPEQLPMVQRGQLVRDLIEEVNAGFISRETAMSKLNPEWTDQRIEEEIESIDGSANISDDSANDAANDLNLDVNPIDELINGRDTTSNNTSI